MKLEKISLDKIDLIPSFNVRLEFGQSESKDLQESIKNTDGNIQPILVCKKGDRFELLSGERRYRALKEAGYTEALCIIYDDLSDLQKTQLMYNENLGRKNLSWKEEVRAVKKLKTLGFDISAAVIARQKGISEATAWDLLKALEAVEEFPDLIEEKSKKDCLKRFEQLKKLEREKQDSIKERKITIKQALTTARMINKKNLELMVVSELKEEVIHYKEKLKNIYKYIRKLDKLERLKNGVWLSNELKQLIEAARSCETFGQLDLSDPECKQCNKQTSEIYYKCEFYHDEVEIVKDKI